MEVKEVGLEYRSTSARDGKIKDLKIPSEVEDFFKKAFGLKAVAFIITDPNQPILDPDRPVNPAVDPVESFVIIPISNVDEPVPFNLPKQDPTGAGCCFVPIGGGQYKWVCF